MDIKTTGSSPTANLPTEEQPSRGVVGVGSVVLSLALYFASDDGVHTIRSTEFDISAHADGFDKALASFVVNAEDYCSYLAKLAQQHEATEEELEMLALLVERVLAVNRERERGEVGAGRDIVADLLRRFAKRNPPEPVWHPQTTPSNFKERSSA